MQQSSDRTASKNIHIQANICSTWCLKHYDRRVVFMFGAVHTNRALARRRPSAAAVRTAPRRAQQPRRPRALARVARFRFRSTLTFSKFHLMRRASAVDGAPPPSNHHHHRACARQPYVCTYIHIYRVQTFTQTQSMPLIVYT